MTQKTNGKVCNAGICANCKAKRQPFAKSECFWQVLLLFKKIYHSNGNQKKRANGFQCRSKFVFGNYCNAGSKKTK